MGGEVGMDCLWAEQSDGFLWEKFWSPKHTLLHIARTSLLDTAKAPKNILSSAYGMKRLSWKGGMLRI